MRNLLERVHDHEGVIDLGAAVGTLANMRPKRRNAEADVAVNQQVDLVGK